MAMVQGNWVKKGTRPGPRSSHAISLVRPKAYAFGGEFSPRVPIDNKMHVFNLETMTWSVLEVTGNIPSPRVCATMAVVRKIIYVFGGRDIENKQPNELYSFNTSTNKWNLLTNGETGPTPQSYHSTTSDDHNVYIFCGYSVAGRLNDLWAYDVIEQKWAKYPTPGDQCKARGGPGLVVAGGKIWVIYGFTGMEVDDVHCYDLVEKRRSQVDTTGKKPIARSVFSTFVIGKFVIIYGGKVNPSDLGILGAGKFNVDIYALDTETLTWKNLDDGLGSANHPGPRGWCTFTSATLNGKPGLLLYGGMSPSNDRLDDIFFFTLCLISVEN